MYDYMIMRYAYPVVLTSDSDGRVLASFPDVPEALTDGANQNEALAEATDALNAALAAYVQHDRPIPVPSAARGHKLVPLSAPVAAKLALYQAMRKQSISKVELARRLGVTETIARRLVDPDHASKIERVEAALEALGVDLVVEDVA